VLKWDVKNGRASGRSFKAAVETSGYWWRVGPMDTLAEVPDAPLWNCPGGFHRVFMFDPLHKLQHPGCMDREAPGSLPQQRSRGAQAFCGTSTTCLPSPHSWSQPQWSRYIAKS